MGLICFCILFSLLHKGSNLFGCCCFTELSGLIEEITYAIKIANSPNRTMSLSSWLLLSVYL